MPEEKQEILLVPIGARLEKFARRQGIIDMLKSGKGPALAGNFTEDQEKAFFLEVSEIREELGMAAA